MQIKYAAEAEKNLIDLITDLAASTGKPFARAFFTKLRERAEALLLTFPRGAVDYPRNPAFKRLTVDRKIYYYYVVEGDVINVARISDCRMQDWEPPKK